MALAQRLRDESDCLEQDERVVRQLEATLARGNVMTSLLDVYAAHFVKRDQQSRVVHALAALVQNPNGLVWTTHADSYDGRIDRLLNELVVTGCVRRLDMRCSVHFARVRPADREKLLVELFATERLEIPVPGRSEAVRCSEPGNCKTARQELVAAGVVATADCTEPDYACIDGAHEWALMAMLAEASGGATLELIDYSRLRVPTVYMPEKMYVFTRYWVPR
jgi:hypothetical protein